MADRPMSDETTRCLIEQKVAYVNSVVNVCMLWWASSIVFSGSVLAAVWSNRGELKQLGFIIGLGIVLFVFFFVVAYFGFLVARRLGVVQDEMAFLATKLRFVGFESGEKSRLDGLKAEDKFFHTEITTFQISMKLGAGSFALICVVWIAFWIYLLGRWWFICIIWVGLWCIGWILLQRRQSKKGQGVTMAAYGGNMRVEHEDSSLSQSQRIEEDRLIE